MLCNIPQLIWKKSTHNTTTQQSVGLRLWIWRVQRLQGGIIISTVVVILSPKNGIGEEAVAVAGKSQCHFMISLEQTLKRYSFFRNWIEDKIKCTKPRKWNKSWHLPDNCCLTFTSAEFTLCTKWTDENHELSQYLSYEIIISTNERSLLGWINNIRL